MPTHQYAVLCGTFPDAPVWASSLNEALALAQDMAEENGIAHFVMEWVCTLEPPSSPPLPLEKIYGVKPGRDFPATLY